MSCYSGYKADEYPIIFTYLNEKLEVKEVTDRWYQGDNDPEFPVSNYFKVRITDGRELIIKHDLKSDRWYLCE